MINILVEINFLEFFCDRKNFGAAEHLVHVREMEGTPLSPQRKTNIGPSHEHCAHSTHHGGRHFKWDVVLKEHPEDNVEIIRHKQGWHSMAPSLRLCTAIEQRCCSETWQP